MNDSIDRQAAIDAIKESMVELAIGVPDDGFNYNAGLKTAIQVISDLPSAQPERKRGNWEQVEVTYIADMDATVRTAEQE